MDSTPASPHLPPATPDPAHDAPVSSDTSTVTSPNPAQHGDVPMTPGSSEAAAAAATLASVANSSQQAPAAAAVAPSPVPAIPNPLPPGYNKDQPICANCSTQTTPLWRRSHDSTHILCNACALFFKMKGRPRPISLKTDVIKSRNRSKGKSTSKDRAGPGAKKQDRSESTSRVRDPDGKGSKKSGPGGSEMEEDELKENGSSTGKVRRTNPPGYPGAWPGGGYPVYPHPHAHQPYPPPRDRSRSSSATRRGASQDRSGGAPPYPYPPPPPGGYHMSPEGYPYYYPGHQGFPGYPGAPYYPPPPPGAGFNHNHAAAAAAAHALAHPASQVSHAQSDSRSGSKHDDAESVSGSASPPPPHPSSGFAPAPPPGYASYYAHQSQYSGSPLNPSSAQASSSKHGLSAPIHTIDQSSANGRLTLAPMTDAGSRGSTPGLPDERPHLPSINSVGSHSRSPKLSSSSTAPNLGSSRHGGNFAAHASGAITSTTATMHDSASKTHDRLRRTSVSSNSAASLSGGSSDGLRSPETSSRPALAWGPPSWVSNDDERRGRPEKRYEDTLDSPELGSGKGKGVVEHGEVDGSHLRLHQQHHQQHHNRMDGVEAGLGDLRVVDQYGATTVASESSRSRSSGNERGRPGRSVVSSARGRSQSNSRARGADRSSSSMGSSSRPASAALQVAEAEIARLKTKVSELTFLNSLMQSRLGQLEGPGRVPSAPMSGLIAPTPAPMRLPDPDEEDEDQLNEDEEDGGGARGEDEDAMMDAEGEAEQPGNDDELSRFLGKVTDPTVRSNLLSFFRSQQVAGGGASPGAGAAVGSA